MASQGLDPSQIPASVPPPGVVPNFVNPESLAPLCLIIICVTLPLMIVFLALRLYVRRYISHAIGADDILCLASAAVVVVFCGITLSFLNNPVGPHQWDIPVSKITVLFQKLTAISTIFYAIGCLFVKSTLLALYLRVFASNPRAKTLIWSGLVFIVLFYTISVIVTAISCTPHVGDDGWQSAIVQERCETIDTRFAVVQGVVGILTDFYVLLIPMSMIAGLRLSQKRKIGIYAIFLTGFLACVVSIVNLVYRIKVLYTYDYTWNEVLIYALCAAELNFGIMCACMPVVFVLFKGVAKKAVTWTTKLRSWTTRNKRSGGDNTELHPYEEVEDRRLPPVPKGTLTGLRSFMRRAYRSRLGNTHVTGNEITQDEILTYISADYDYHAHLHRPNLTIATSVPRGQNQQG